MAKLRVPCSHRKEPGTLHSLRRRIARLRRRWVWGRCDRGCLASAKLSAFFARHQIPAADSHNAPYPFVALFRAGRPRPCSASPHPSPNLPPVPGRVPQHLCPAAASCPLTCRSACAPASRDLLWALPGLVSRSPVLRTPSGRRRLPPPARPSALSYPPVVLLFQAAAREALLLVPVCLLPSLAPLPPISCVLCLFLPLPDSPPPPLRPLALLSLSPPFPPCHHPTQLSSLSPFPSFLPAPLLFLLSSLSFSLLPTLFLSSPSPLPLPLPVRRRLIPVVWGRRVRSSPRSGKPTTWRRDSVPIPQ